MTVCAAIGCTNPVPATGRPGRPTVYCSPSCRPSHKPRTPRRAPPLLVDLVDTNNDTNPPGRNPHSWAVRLRRGTTTVTIANHLGRFTATALANDIQQLIKTQRGATD